MADPHPLDVQLQNHGIIKYLESKKDELHKMIVCVYGANYHFHKQKKIDKSIVENIIWQIIRLDPHINKFFILQNEYLPELNGDLRNGVASVRIVQIIFEIVENSFGEDYILGDNP